MEIENLKIEVDDQEGYYRAIALGLPEEDSPEGIGESEYEAVGHLIFLLNIQKSKWEEWVNMPIVSEWIKEEDEQEDDEDFGYENY